VKGIDVVFIGPYDLTQSLNLHGQIDNFLVIKKIIELTKLCKSSGMATGIFADSIEAASN
jgi:4-hydroxy-2-oxoheptanedioate aldolase